MAIDQTTAELVEENRALRALLASLDQEYELNSSWYGGGCEHGFKPASSCPNKKCAVSDIQRRWDRLMTPNKR